MKGVLHTCTTILVSRWYWFAPIFHYVRVIAWPLSAKREKACNNTFVTRQCSRIPLPVTRGKWNLRSGNWKTECYLPVGKWISCHYPKHILVIIITTSGQPTLSVYTLYDDKKIDFFLNLHKSNQRKTVKKSKPETIQ